MLCFSVRFLFVFLCVPHRRCYLLGSGSLWHLPHLWFKGHILYRVAGSAAGKHLQISSSRLTRTLVHTCRILSCCQIVMDSPFLSFRVASPAACLLDLCRFSVDMTRRSPVWPSALNWTWLSRGQRSEISHSVNSYKLDTNHTICTMSNKVIM